MNHFRVTPASENILMVVERAPDGTSMTYIFQGVVSCSVFAEAVDPDTLPEEREPMEEV